MFIGRTDRANGSVHWPGHFSFDYDFIFPIYIHISIFRINQFLTQIIFKQTQGVIAELITAPGAGAAQAREHGAASAPFQVSRCLA